jgi:hypothetical protein
MFCSAAKQNKNQEKIVVTKENPRRRNNSDEKINQNY